MTNETKQPTLPEALKLARDALVNCEGMLDEIRHYPITHDSIIEALAALDSLQVGEPVGEYILAPGGTWPSLVWSDKHKPKVGLKLYTAPQPCSRCAELGQVAFQAQNAAIDLMKQLAALEAENKSLKELFTVDKDGTTMADMYLDLKAENKRQSALISSQGIRAMEDADTIAQLAAELKRINNVANCGTVDSWLSLSDEDKRKWFAMTLHTDSAKAKIIKEQDYQIAQQAERIKELEQRVKALEVNLSTDTETIVRLHEKLATVEKDAERYRAIREGSLPIFAIEDLEQPDLTSRTLYDEDLDQAIDAAIAASKEGKS